MPYVPAWERLAEAHQTCHGGLAPERVAQIDLCRAIADGTVNIRCKLKRHTTGFTSKAVLEGKDFEIPTEIKPEDLNWETSCPVKHGLVRRGSYSIPGYWELEWIEVCRADVTKALCAAKEQDENTQHASRRRRQAQAGCRAKARSNARCLWSPRATAGPRKRVAAGPGCRRVGATAET